MLANSYFSFRGTSEKLYFECLHKPRKELFIFPKYTISPISKVNCNVCFTLSVNYTVHYRHKHASIWSVTQTRFIIVFYALFLDRLQKQLTQNNVVVMMTSSVSRSCPKFIVRQPTLVDKNEMNMFRFSVTDQVIENLLTKKCRFRKKNCKTVMSNGQYCSPGQKNMA